MLKWIPNILTMARCILTIVFLGMILYASPEYTQTKPPFPSFLDTALILFVVAGLTDVVDGPIARKLNVTSRLGRLMDPLADKILVCGAFLCLAIVKQPTFEDFAISDFTQSLIRWSVAAIVITRELVVTILRHAAEAKGIEFGAVISGKLKMLFQSFAIGTVMVKWAHVLRPWGDWFTAVIFVLMIAITIFSGLQSIQRAIAKKVFSLK